MDTKKRILMIPSWYPTQKHKVGGFFQNQATVLLKYFDMRVLFGFPTELGRKKWLLRRGIKPIYPIEKEWTPDGLPEYRFEYISWKLDESSLINSIINGYKKMIADMIAEGWKPDIIHAQCTQPAGIVASNLSEYFRIPWVLTEHQTFALDNYSKYRAGLMRNAIKSAKMVAVVSQHQLRCIAIHDLFPNTIVTGNFINEELFKLSLPQAGQHLFRILTVTWPSKTKGTETFFRAIASMIEKGHDDIEVVVIGKQLFTENDISDFLNFADKYSVSHVCQFLPRVPHTEIEKYYAESDVFVSTSVTETFGIAVREAMAVGRPVVCTASGGVDDDIHAFNGFKVNIYDHEAISDALIAIKTGEKQYDPIKIRQYIVEKYGQQPFIKKMKYFYDHATLP
jgi:glycosyltransferase involved in cell wall biosynthesis